MLDEPQDPQEAIRLLKSMDRSLQSPGTRNVLKWLRSELQRFYVENSVETVDLTYKQRQGACQLLAKLLDMMETSRDRCEKIERDSNSNGINL